MLRKNLWYYVLTFSIIISCINPVSASLNTPFTNLKKKSPSYVEEGIASWYGPGFHGRKTASGEYFNTYDFTAAHRTLPFGTYLKVTNLENGRSTIVKINDRGPYVFGRIIDLSFAAKEELGMGGLARVRLEIYNEEEELQEEETEVEGFSPSNLFEDVILKKYNSLNKVYTFKKIDIKLLSPNTDEAIAQIYMKNEEEDYFNSSEPNINLTSGYIIKILKTKGDYDTKALIEKLEEMGYNHIFVQVIPKKDSSIFFVLTGIYPTENDAKTDINRLEKEGFTVKLCKFRS